MATGKITKKSIDALEPSSASQLLWDTDLKGFGAKITPAGSISYVLYLAVFNYASLEK